MKPRGPTGATAASVPGQPRPPGSSAANPIGISELNERIRIRIERNFPSFWVRGEVSDFKAPRSGHWYFSLRDRTAQIPCVVWSSDQRGIPAAPEDGMEIVALAQLTFYPLRGSVQLQLSRVEASGDGLWRKAMEETLARLRAEGLLAPERKRPIPRFPKCVAVVTSISGAAIRDIVAVARRRRPGMQIVISQATVQGDDAAVSICAAIERVVRWNSADVLIVGRGGGSREDLRPFNDERVARAIAACTIPVISAVGHEVDITVSDLAADARAATPSAAAEAAVPSLAELAQSLEVQRRRIVGAASRRRDAARQNLRQAARDLRLASLRSLDARTGSLSAAAGRLNALSPVATLARGYSVASGADGQTLATAGDFQVGEAFDLTVRDGRITARTERISRSGW